ncbi:MAG: vWA domain-containing protein [bacterium]
MHNILRNSIAAMVLATVSATAVAVSQPLLIPGKQSLYQRVLSVPGAALGGFPGEKGSNETAPFTAYYVYDRVDRGGEQWLLVGTDSHGGVSGWLNVGDTLQWTQGLTVAFKNNIGEDRTLLFRDKDALQTLANESTPGKYQALYKQATEGKITEDSPVVAIQPEGFIDIRKNFYLVPIQDFQDIYVGDEAARMLKVSSVPLEQGAADAEPAVAPVEAEKTATNDGDYRAGIVFAIDSTLSMGPYIDRTRDAVQSIYDQVGDTQLNVDFGLVGYRDNPEASPGLNYLTDTVVGLKPGTSSSDFMKQFAALKPADVSSQDFVEDAYAGVKSAIENIQWQPYDARYVVLITDAGARESGDPLSGTGMSAATLRQLARDNDVAIFVLHLLTPAQMANHDRAAAQYQTLSDYPGIGSLYYGVETGDVKRFGKVLDTLAGQITGQVQQAGGSKATPTKATGNDAQLAQLQTKVAKLGYALRMQYLQNDASGVPPRVFDAWILDRDFNKPERETLDVRILLTRDQLSDLHDVLAQVLLAAEEGLLSPQTFLDELKSLAATVSRDPEKLGATTASTAGEGNSLADLGFMREYIEGLPYTGEVMQLSLDEWQSWPAQKQVAFLHRLEEKIRYYRALHDHTDLWVSLDNGPIDGDSVFPLSLDMLP